jgi:hypothetical protein
LKHSHRSAAVIAVIQPQFILVALDGASMDVATQMATKWSVGFELNSVMQRNETSWQADGVHMFQISLFIVLCHEALAKKSSADSWRCAYWLRPEA